MEEVSGVSVVKFAEARASEIASLMQDVNHLKNKTAVQRLPPHMRRRAASHKPRRVPRKLRDSYLVQNPHANSKPKKAPRNVRKQQQKKKHENQAKNYPVEYASRSRPGELWLGTHIWHAKRCKMDTVWGYKLPIHCNDKKLGATHQAATKHAMLQDLSYLSCISLNGPEEKLLNCLSCLTDSNSGSNFASATYLDGAIEGHTFLYYPCKCPYEAIGPVSFFWKPDVCITSGSGNQNFINKRSLWIWCHPSFHDELVKVLVQILNLEEVKKDSSTNNVSVEENEINDMVYKEPTDDSSTVFYSKVNLERVRQHYFKEHIFSNGDVQMSLLKDKLVRHRVIGPNSQSVIVNVLEMADVSSTSSEVLVVSNNRVNSVEKALIIDAPDSVSDHKSLKHKNVFDENEYPSSKKIKLKLVSADDEYSFSKSIKQEPIDYNKESVFLDPKTLKNVSELSKNIMNGSENVRSDSKLTTKLAFNEALHEPAKKKLEVHVEEESDKFSAAVSKLQWWKMYYECEKAQKVHVKKKKLLESLRNGRSNYYIAPSSIIGLTVRDPRLILSRNKEKHAVVQDDDIGKSVEELLTPEIADSPLWNDMIRNEVTATQIPENDINNERSKHVVSSEIANFGDKESRVPILLIHQPGKNGFGSGWDIIAPLGWSMAFWVPLVLNGGRVTGLKDLHFVNMEIGQPSFPLSYPDSNSGKTYEEKQRINELTTYYKRPKAKRPNFSTFGTPNPFFMPWNVLVNDWIKELKKSFSGILFPAVSPEDLKVDFSESDLKPYYVMRNKDVRSLQNLCERLGRLPRGKKATQELDNLKKLFNEFVFSSLSSHKELINALVLIRTKCLTRGCPSVHSGIYQLDEEDLNKIKCSPNFLGPVEPNHNKLKNTDSTQTEKSTIADTNDRHRKQSGDFQNSYKDSEVKNKEQSVDCQTSSKDLIAENEENSNKSTSKSDCHIISKDLERPLITTLSCSTSRKMIGYLSEGGFSSISGKGCGIGHCSVLGLLSVIRDCINHQLRPVVLVREQHSFQYRASSLEIVPNYL